MEYIFLGPPLILAVLFIGLLIVGAIFGFTILGLKKLSNLTGGQSHHVTGGQSHHVKGVKA